MANPASALNEAQILLSSGDAPRAVALLRRLAQKEPNNPAVNHALGRALTQSGDHTTAAYFLERAMRLAPKSLEVRDSFAGLLGAMGKTDRAVEVLEETLKMDAGHYPAHLNLLALQITRGDRGAALEAGRAAYARFPDEVEIARRYYVALQNCNLIPEVIAVLRQARARQGTSMGLQKLLMQSINYASTLTPEEIFAEHVEIGRLLGAAHPQDPSPHTNDPDPERPLRVGYVSQDFRNRSAAHFIEPILANHDRGRYLAYCYSSTPEADEMTARLRSCSAGWTEVRELSERALADRIRADRIDIMFDLTGHAGGNRVAALSYKPAPIQATYMGYANTTGLKAIDYRIVDSITDPAPGADHLATERLARLDPCFLCYAPPPHAPDVAARPPSADGSVVFGSFNTLAKQSPPVIELWSRLLREVPHSRLILKNRDLGEPWNAGHVRESFGAHGIGPERLDLRGETKTAGAHLGAYSEVDIALDPFPYNGTTTTVEAMWMGVPVVVLEGNSHASRVGMSLLNVVGLGDLVGRSGEDYVRIAAELARDLARLKDLRGTLRERVRGSPLCDAPGFTRRFEGLLRGWWRDWCAGRGR